MPLRLKMHVASDLLLMEEERAAQVATYSRVGASCLVSELSSTCKAIAPHLCAS